MEKIEGVELNKQFINNKDDDKNNQIRNSEQFVEGLGQGNSLKYNGVFLMSKNNNNNNKMF